MGKGLFAEARPGVEVSAPREKTMAMAGSTPRAMQTPIAKKSGKNYDNAHKKIGHCTLVKAAEEFGAGDKSDARNEQSGADVGHETEHLLTLSLQRVMSVSPTVNVPTLLARIPKSRATRSHTGGAEGDTLYFNSADKIADCGNNENKKQGREQAAQDRTEINHIFSPLIMISGVGVSHRRQMPKPKRRVSRFGKM